jgi:flagellar basal body-associated protein FliL
MAEAEQEDEGAKRGDDGAGEGASKPSGRRRLLTYVVSGVLSVGLGLGAGVVQTRRHESKPEEKHVSTDASPTLDEFPILMKLELPRQIFNCADTGRVVAASINVELEVRTTADWGLPIEKNKLKNAIDPKEGKYYGRIRDGLVMLLSTKMSGDLQSARGKEVLKLEILEKMNTILFSGKEKDDPKGVVTEVLFTDFLVQ